MGLYFEKNPWKLEMGSFFCQNVPQKWALEHHTPILSKSEYPLALLVATGAGTNFALFFLSQRLTILMQPPCER